MGNSGCCQRNEGDAALEKADAAAAADFPEIQQVGCEKELAKEPESKKLPKNYSSEPADSKKAEKARQRASSYSIVPAGKNRRVSLCDLVTISELSSTPHLQRHGTTGFLGERARAQTDPEKSDAITVSQYQSTPMLKLSKSFIIELEVAREQRLQETAELVLDHVDEQEHGHGIVGRNANMRVSMKVAHSKVALKSLRRSITFDMAERQRMLIPGEANSDSDRSAMTSARAERERGSGNGRKSVVFEYESEGKHEDTRMPTDFGQVLFKRRLKRSNSVLAEIGRGASNALQIMVENPRDIHEVYDVANTIGKGSFGVVKITTVKASGAVRAVKSIQKDAIGDKCNLSMLKTEIKITKMVDHPNIVQLYEIFEDALNLHLVMELCEGGHLEKRTEHRNLTEKEVAICMKQILRAVLYLHNNAICHRDIKPQNVLLIDGNLLEKSGLKVTDFGISCFFKPNQVLKARVGTKEYMAPEVLKKRYDKGCDVWSCGVVMYVLFGQVFPFPGKDKEECFQRIAAGNFSFGAGFVDASQAAMDFVSQMLTVAPERISALDALNHSWFTQCLPAIKDSELSASLFSNLCKFKKQGRFFKASSCLIASLLSKEQVSASSYAFHVLDQDGDGIVTAADVKGYLTTMLSNKKTGRPQQVALRQIQTEVGNGFESYAYTEFLAATFDRKKYIKKDICKAAFSAFDQDGDGCVTLGELASGSLLGHLKTSELVKLVEDCDLNGDGEIDFDEFLHMMRNAG